MKNSIHQVKPAKILPSLKNSEWEQYHPNETMKEFLENRGEPSSINNL